MSYSKVLAWIDNSCLPGRRSIKFSKTTTNIKWLHGRELRNYVGLNSQHPAARGSLSRNQQSLDHILWHHTFPLPHCLRPCCSRTTLMGQSKFYSIMLSSILPAS
uniref:Uncharacterized protein MANES_12G054100 n=1 Tax=Rhizophora mucronata TaxID=61149 RepID=A0A2P2JEJ7_RHIMU